MVGSMDSLEFSSEINVKEKNAVPLDCWHEINLPNIWIPSHLLSNRSKPSNMKVRQGIYHTLEKKDSSKYAKSFSVYSFPNIENGQEEIFISDSDEDIFGSDSASTENTQVSDNTLSAIANHAGAHSSICSNDLRNSIETDIFNKNPERGMHFNLKENFIANERTSLHVEEICEEERVKKITSNENMINMKESQQHDSKECSESLSNNINTRSQKHLVLNKENHELETGAFGGRLNKNTDSISLKDIIDDTSEINLKDFEFELKKKDDSFLLCTYDKKEKKLKKNKKDKVKKKPSKCIMLDTFLDTNIEADQDYYCDKYFNSILNEKEKNNSCSNIPIGSNLDFPHLASDGIMFSESNKTVKENYVKSTFSDLFKSEKVNENDVKSTFRDLFKSEKVNENDVKSTCSDCIKSEDVNGNDVKSTLSNLIKSEEVNENIDGKEIKPCITDATYGKIVIENIPSDVIEEDILGILCGYGEIKKFSLVSVGSFLTAYVIIDLNCDIDIDWIIECLNESEPFGASSRKILCYKQ